MWKLLQSLALFLALGACALDKSEALKARLAPHLYILEEMHFASKGSCTAAVYELALGEFRKTWPRAETLDEALAAIKAQRPVQLALEGLSPHEISEAVMSRDLPLGLGLISSGIGPARDCMDERIRRGYTRVLQFAVTQMVYLPEENALLLLYPPEKLAFFLRGNV